MADEDAELFEGWESEALAPALAPLTRLTRLFIEDPPPAAALPASLSSLRQLQRFGWMGASPEDLRLPPGQWLAGLRELALPADVAENSAAQLKQATRLERLRVQDFLGASTAALLRSRQRLLSDTAALPRLQALRLGWTGDSALTAAQVQRVAAALRRHQPPVKVKVDSSKDLHNDDDD